MFTNISVELLSHLNNTEGEKEMNKYFINVAKYANDNGLSLEQAHEEIQLNLFNDVYNWKHPSYQNKVVLSFAEYLELNMEEPNCITQCSSESFTESDYDFEVTFDRSVNLVWNIDRVETTPEYVEFNGKQYEKSKLEQALKLIEGDE